MKYKKRIIGAVLASFLSLTCAAYMNKIPQKSKCIQVEESVMSSDLIINEMNRQYLNRCACTGFLDNHTIKDKNGNLKLNIDNFFYSQDNYTYVLGDSLVKENLVKNYADMWKCTKSVVKELFWDEKEYFEMKKEVVNSYSFNSSSF
jgi:hypothetical protein